LARKVNGKNKTISGFYVAKNKSKYGGNARNIFYRSSWEKHFCKWCDLNPNVISWIIEPMFINYYDEGLKKARKYYPDFWVEMTGGVQYLIEIKPKYETEPPKMKPTTEKGIIAEQTYVTNMSKWKAAKEYCKKKKWGFKIVTEDTLTDMGIKLIHPLKRPKAPGVTKKNTKYANHTSKKRIDCRNKRK